MIVPAKKKWSRQVKTVSTRPPAELFTKSAAAIARSMASKRVRRRTRLRHDIAAQFLHKLPRFQASQSGIAPVGGATIRMRA